MLENLKWSEASFVTLTYAPENLCLVTGGIGTLVPKDSQDWLKRLRLAISPARVRYYLVGEYGEENGGPHYHVALFGYAGCVYGDSRLCPGGKRGRECDCPSCILVRKTWGKGRVHQGVIERKSCQYIAGYTVEGMTDGRDFRLAGRHPEFARMSLRPGIGGDAMWDVVEVVRKFGLEGPDALRHGSRVLPLGRYLGERIRKGLGCEKKGYLEEAEMLAMRAHAERVASDGKASWAYADKILADAISALNEVRGQSLAVRRALYERGKQ